MYTVKQRQQNLTKLGFRLGVIDGIAGKHTTAAIKRFQRAWNLGPKLKIDGKYGPKTDAALRETMSRDGKLSPSFTARELKCKCPGYVGCKGIHVRRADLRALEKLRKTAYPNGLRIVSAYRCPTHNKRVGGASLSMHLQGRAFDIPPVVKTGSDKIPARFRGQGYNLPGQRVRHVDSRPVITRWKY